MDLSKKTYLELLELRKEIGEAMEEYDKKTKTQVYSIYNYTDWDNYLHKENAEQALNKILLDNEVVLSEDGIKTAIRFIETPHVKYCQDYKEE